MQKINKLKEIWKALKSSGLPLKAATASNIKRRKCLKEENEIVFDETKNCLV